MALCLALSFSHYSNAQTDPTTGNLINPGGWFGVTYGTHPGDCCTGGPQPLYDTSNNTINFSYGNYNVANLIDFTQNQALSQPGIFVTGYNYSWTIVSESQNGLDPVNASIGLYAPSGMNLENYFYPSMYSGNYSGSQNFTRPYSLTEARYLQVNFAAYDQGFWAGYYGPKVSNINVNVKYSADICAVDPLSSSSCPGYAQAYLTQQCSINPLYNVDCPGYQQAYFNQQCSISPLYNATCPGYAQAYFTYQCSINPLYNQSCPGYAQAYFNQQCTINQLYSVQCPGYAQAKALKDLQEQQNKVAETSTPTSSSSSQQTTISEALVDPTKTETVVTTDVGGVELTTSGEISIPTGEPTATKEAIKEAAASEEKKSEEKKKVNPKALAVARAAIAETEKTALSVSEAAVIQSQSESVIGLGSGLTIQGFRPIGVPTEEENNRSSSITQQRQNSLDLQNRGVIVTQEQETQNKSGSSVRNGGKVEGMEGGPDPTQLAKASIEFNQYLNMQLRDSQFYSPKEIYKNQKVVDNESILRQMNRRSDRLHEEMVNQQFK